MVARSWTTIDTYSNRPVQPFRTSPIDTRNWKPGASRREASGAAVFSYYAQRASESAALRGKSAPQLPLYALDAPVITDADFDCFFVSCRGSKRRSELVTGDSPDAARGRPLQQQFGAVKPRSHAVACDDFASDEVGVRRRVREARQERVDTQSNPNSTSASTLILKMVLSPAANARGRYRARCHANCARRAIQLRLCANGRRR